MSSRASITRATIGVLLFSLLLACGEEQPPRGTMDGACELSATSATEERSVCINGSFLFRDLECGEAGGVWHDAAACEELGFAVQCSSNATLVEWYRDATSCD